MHDLQFVVHRLDPLHSGSGLLGLGLEVGTGRLPGQQHHAVEAGDDDVRLGVQVRVGLGHVHANLGFDQRVVDLAAEGAGAAVILNGAFTAGVHHRGASADAEAQRQGQ
ncbi:hypothetical protein D3C81_2042630 [compost metagenome]